MTDELSSMESAVAEQTSVSQSGSESPQIEHDNVARVNGTLPDGDQGSTWRWSDDVAADGEAPDWFMHDKYQNVSEQAKAYTELSKKFGQFSGAPKDGYDLEKYKDALDMENPFLVKIMESAKEMNMSQGGLDQLLELVKDYEEQSTFNPKDFMESLNSDEKNMAALLSQWGQNNFSSDEFDILSSWITDKSSLNLLAKIRGMGMSQARKAQPSTVRRVTQKDIEQMVINNYKQYSNDPAYRARIERMRSELPPED